MPGDYTKETRVGPEVQLPLEMHFKLKRPHQNSPPTVLPKLSFRLCCSRTIPLLFSWLAFVIQDSIFPSPNSVSSSVSSKSYHCHLNPSGLFLSRLSSSLEEMIAESSSVCVLHMGSWLSTGKLDQAFQLCCSDPLQLYKFLFCMIYQLLKRVCYKFPTMMVDLSILPHNSVNFCCIIR